VNLQLCERQGIPRSDKRLIANQVFSVVSTSRGNLNIVLLRWFVKAEMTYIQHTSCRVCKNYQSSLNELKDLICKRVLRVFACVWLQQAIIFSRDHGITVCVNSLLKVENIVIKKSVHVTELDCFVSSLLNWLADLLADKTGCTL